MTEYDRVRQKQSDSGLVRQSSVRDTNTHSTNAGQRIRCRNHDDALLHRTLGLHPQQPQRAQHPQQLAARAELLQLRRALPLVPGRGDENDLGAALPALHRQRHRHGLPDEPSRRPSHRGVTTSRRTHPTSSNTASPPATPPARRSRRPRSACPSRRLFKRAPTRLEPRSAARSAAVRAGSGGVAAGEVGGEGGGRVGDVEGVA